MSPEERERYDNVSKLVVLMHPGSDCPVVIGNGSYNHALLLADHLAPLLAEAERRAVYRLLDEQGVRYRKHSALALEEDVALASELFGVDFRAALQRGAL